MVRSIYSESIDENRERSPLLPSNQPVAAGAIHCSDSSFLQAHVVSGEHVHRVLFLALSISIAMAATATTTVFAYAVILCEDPAQCKDEEKSAYAGAVALASGIANVCGILALGPLQYAIQSNVKYGLLFWITSRGTSVAILALAGMHFVNLCHVVYLMSNCSGQLDECFSYVNDTDVPFVCCYSQVQEYPLCSPGTGIRRLCDR